MPSNPTSLNPLFCLNLGSSTLPSQAPLPSPPGFCPVGLITQPTLGRSPSVSGRASPPQSRWSPTTSPPPSSFQAGTCCIPSCGRTPRLPAPPHSAPVFLPLSSPWYLSLISGSISRFSSLFLLLFLFEVMELSTFYTSCFL